MEGTAWPIARATPHLDGRPHDLCHVDLGHGGQGIVVTPEDVDGRWIDVDGRDQSQPSREEVAAEIGLGHARR